MTNRIGKILSSGLEKHELLNKSTKNKVDLFIEQTNDIVNFLQKKFSSKTIDETQISKIFDTTIKILSKKNNPNLLKKTTIIFLDYIKKEFYFKQKNISKNFSQKITSNFFLKPYFSDYIKEILYSINNKNIEPSREFAFIFFLYGANDNFDLINDFSKNNISGISRIVQKKINKINHSSSPEEIEEFCILMDVINQLTLIQGINAEDKIIGTKLYTEILLKKTKGAIHNFLSTKDKKFINKLSGIEDDNIFYTDIYKNDLTEDELFKLNKLQDILGKFYGNFSANLEYIKNDKKNSGATIGGKIGFILDKIVYGSILREKAKFGNLKGEELKENIKKSSQVRDGNIAFTKLLYIKKLEEVKEKTPEQLEIISFKELFLKDLIFIYNNICKGCLKESKINTSGNIENIINEVIEHFTLSNKPDYFQIIVIYKLILFNDLNYENLNKIADYLANQKNSPSIHFEKFKIKTFELIVQKLTQNLSLICDKLYCDGIDCIHKDNLAICNKIINKIEKYISKNNKESLIFNYGKIYLILSKLYSLGVSNSSQEKSKKYYHIFHEKYGNILPIELENLIEEIKINYARFELRKYGIDKEEIGNKFLSKILDRKKLIHGGEEIVAISKKNFLLSETNRIQDGISKLILKIQNNEYSYVKSGNDTEVKKEICSLLEREVFNNLCRITIEPKGKEYLVGRFEKIVKVENDFFDIIFLYSNIYNSPFQYIFSQKKDLIKNSIIQLIDIFSIHAKTFNSFNTIKKLASKVIEAKDSYTNGHVDRVEAYSIAIGIILGFDGIALQELQTEAIMHDYGKLFIDDAILKKPGKLTDEEFLIMRSHTGLGIIEGIKDKFEPSNLEGMAHHGSFYDPDGNPNLKYNILIEKYKENPTSISPHDFNKLQGHHIPLASRIITIADVIDAIASRRIYDKRAGWDITKLLEEIDNELLKCSGLVRKNGNIELNNDLWIKAEGKITSPCFFHYGKDIFVPSNNSPKIQFDPAIVSTFLSEKEKYSFLKNQIITTDKKNVASKIIEFKESIKMLKSKKASFLEILESTNNNIKGLPKEVIFNDYDQKDLERLEEILPQLISIQEKYKQKNK